MNNPRSKRARFYVRGALWLSVLIVDILLLRYGEDRYVSHLILAGIAANYIT